jgi:hypothetical protein
VIEMECVGVPAWGKLRRGWAGPRWFVENGWRDQRDELGCGKRIGLVGGWYGGVGLWSLTPAGLKTGHYTLSKFGARRRQGCVRCWGGLWGLTLAGLKTGHYLLNKFGARWREGSVRCWGWLWGLSPTGLKTGHYRVNRFGARWRQGCVR